MSESLSYLEPQAGQRLAYHASPAQGVGASLPGVVFLGGYASDMTGSKALALEAYTQSRGQAFLRFDYQGHGASSGRFEDGTIGTWFKDALAVFDALTRGPQILIGSSMGGWIMLLLARARPDRVAGLIGIAAAPDFTEDLMWAGFSEEQREILRREGRLALPSDYSDEPYGVTLKLIEDGRDHLLLREPLAFHGPVRLLHGREDEDVPWEVSTKILEAIESEDATLTLVKGGDHRLSEPRDLDRLMQTLESLSQQLSR